MTSGANEVHSSCSSYLYGDNYVQPGDNLDVSKLDITYFM